MREITGKKRIDDRVIEVPLTIETIRTPNHRFPDDISTSQLEVALNDAFSIRGMAVVREFLIPHNPEYPQNLEYFTRVREQTANQDLAGGSITETEAIANRDGVVVPYRYINKLFVPKSYQGNGLFGHIMDDTLSPNLGEQIPILAVLRTSSRKLHDEKYEPRSDIWVKIGNYYVHGFNFLNKITDSDRPERFPGAFKLFDGIAHHVALKVPTAVPISGAGFSYLE